MFNSVPYRFVKFGTEGFLGSDEKDPVFFKIAPGNYSIQFCGNTPEDLLFYYEHYIPEEQRFATCNRNDCCNKLQKAAERCLTYIIYDGNVCILQLKPALIQQVNLYFRRYKKLTERSFALIINKADSWKNKFSYTIIGEEESFLTEQELQQFKEFKQKHPLEKYIPKREV